MSQLAHANTIAAFDISSAGAGRPYINVNIQDADGQFQPVKLLSDSGNDVTLINPRTAHQLGFDREDVRAYSTPFKVQGIANAPLDFYMVKQYIQIDGLEPIAAKIGIGPVRENLLGREDILDNYSITLTKKKVIFMKLGDNGLGLYQPADQGYDITSHFPDDLSASNRNRHANFANI